MELIQELMNKIREICVNEKYDVELQARFKKRNHTENYNWSLKKKDGDD